MENFKEIAEKCLAGELSGIFKNRKGENIPSGALCRYSSKTYPYSYYYSKWVCVTVHGDFFKSGKFSEYDIIDFIPDNMQEQIKIDIPEGKVPVMEQTENGVVITWKEKELTYNDICFEFINNSKFIHNYIRDAYVDSSSSQPFYKKVEVFRKLINIRNYFGKPKVGYDGFVITCEFGEPIIVSAKVCPIECSVIFAEEEHAEQAIKMLGDELKYLFEPW